MSGRVNANEANFTTRLSRALLLYKYFILSKFNLFKVYTEFKLNKAQKNKVQIERV